MLKSTSHNFTPSRKRHVSFSEKQQVYIITMSDTDLIHKTALAFMLALKNNNRINKREAHDFLLKFASEKMSSSTRMLWLNSYKDMKYKKKFHKLCDDAHESDVTLKAFLAELSDLMPIVSAEADVEASGSVNTDPSWIDVVGDETGTQKSEASSCLTSGDFDSVGLE